ncbi:MAG: succinyl-diaminopimelate desuccinylase, partial [Planctomycetota bacterium]
MNRDPATELEDLALRLLAIPSVIEHEAEIADFCHAWLEEKKVHGLTRAGDNIACQPRPFRDDVPRVLLLGHLDTVPASDENLPRLEGERIFGLGSSDMKCADALILYLVAKALERAPRYDLSVVLYAREEGPYEGSGLPEIMAAAPGSFQGVNLAVAMEPTGNCIELGCLGTLHARVRLLGKRAHSGRPWEGENAIHLAAPLLGRLASLEPRDVNFEGLLFRESCSATMIEYQGARNVVPESCTVNVNFRYGPDRAADEAIAWLEELVVESSGRDLFEAGKLCIEIGDLCPSGRVPSENPLLESLRGLGTLPTKAKQAWTDVGRLSQMGLDAINFGPGLPSQAHQRGEY